MDLETQKRIMREKIAGFKALREFEIEEMRKATFADRLRGFRQIMRFAQRMRLTDSRQDDDEVMQKWAKIRKHYESNSR